VHVHVAGLGKTEQEVQTLIGISIRYRQSEEARC